MTTFNTWTNPRSGETRIYINDRELLSYGEKAFIKQTDNEYLDWELVILGEGMGQSRRETIERLVEDAVEQKTEKNINDVKWEDILAITKK